jgi:hypothetical protein
VLINNLGRTIRTCTYVPHDPDMDQTQQPTDKASYRTTKDAIWQNNRSLAFGLPLACLVMIQADYAVFVSLSLLGYCCLYLTVDLQYRQSYPLHSWHIFPGQRHLDEQSAACFARLKYALNSRTFTAATANLNIIVKNATLTTPALYPPVNY